MKKLLLGAVAAFVAVLSSGYPAHASTMSTANGDGSMVVSWSARSGDCTINYTEADQKMYKYQTVAACSNGSQQINYLVAGRRYRVQVVSSMGSEVSRVIAKRGWMAVKTTAMVAPKHETLPRDPFVATMYHGCNSQGTMVTDGRLNHDERSYGRCGTGVTNFSAVEGKQKGEVTIYWTPSVVSQGQYHLVYGTSSEQYPMGALNVGGSSNRFTVRGLTSGQRYYFRLLPVHSDTVAGLSWEVSARAR